MAENKAKLLKNNSKYHWIADRKILKHIFKKSLSLKGLLIFATIFLSFSALELFLKKEVVVPVVQNAPFFAVLVVVLIYNVVIRNKKERYSSVERMGIYYFFVFQFINLFFNSFFAPKESNINDFLLMKISTAILLFILVILTLSALEFKKDYKSTFKLVAK